MNKAIMLYIIVILAFQSIVLMQDAESAIFQQYPVEQAMSGYINTDAFGVETVYNEIDIIHICGNAGNINYGYLSFNTSAIDPDMTIISSSINIYYLTRDISPLVDQIIYISPEDYGPTLTDADSPPLIPFFPEDVLMPGANVPFGWKNSALNTSYVNATGITQLCIKTGNTADMQFYVNKTGYVPYLTINLLPKYGALITYNFTAAGMTNYTTTIQPVEIIDQGTKDLYRYEFWSSNQTITQLVLPSTNFTYNSINPYATMTNPTVAVWNFTDLVPNCLYWVWFTLNKTVYCDVWISLYRESTGEGVDFKSWVTYINDGSFTNTLTMQRVSEPEISLILGNAYVVSVYDYFPTPNFITNYSFVVNDTTQFVDVPVPFSPLNFKSYRTDFTAFRIWFNSNISYSPFQDHIPPEEWYSAYVRGGSWMIAIDYLQTTINGTASIISTYFLNITTNSSLAYSIKISNTSIQTIMTTLSGMNTTINSINSLFMPSQQNIYYLLPEPPMGGTRSGLTTSEGAFIWRHPYMITEATIHDNSSGTSMTFANNRPTNGTVRWLNDYLFITSANNNAGIFINNSAGTNIINFTTNPGFVDMTGYDLSNYTIWSNVSCNIHRQSEFRNVQIFYWQYYPTTLMYTVGQTLANPATLQWTNVYWFIGFATNDDGQIETAATDSIRVYDVDNSLVLELGNNYDVSQGGIELFYAYLNASTSHTLQFTYWLENATSTPQSTPIISIRQYSISTWQGESMYMGNGQWVNNRTAPYTGDIAISLKSLSGDIQPSSVVVYDNTNSRQIIDEYFTVSGSTITLNADAVGLVGSKESRDYTVYYLLSKDNPRVFFLFDSNWRIGWIQINAHLCIFGAALLSAGYGSVNLITSRKQQTDAKGFGWVLIGVFLFLIYIGTYILHSMGLL